MRKKKDEYTPEQFATKIGVSRSTVYRWIQSERIRLKMYDAEVVEMAGKRFIKVRG